MILGSGDAEREAVLSAARLMVTAARTAPKGGGRDCITTAILYAEEKDRLADIMLKMEKDRGQPPRDSLCVREADAVVLIGVKIEGVKMRPFERDLQTRFSLDFRDFRLIDLGIALGSAVKTASMLNIDNRIMATVGIAAEKMGIIEGKVQGIPLSVKGKNIFFDRKVGLP